jgi:hypothetical protein
MNIQDIINAAQTQVASETVTDEQKLVDKAIEQFDFKKYFIIDKKPNVLVLINILTSTSLEKRELIESLAAQKLTSLGYSFEKVGIGGFLVENPAKHILGIS